MSNLRAELRGNHSAPEPEARGGGGLLGTIVLGLAAFGIGALGMMYAAGGMPALPKLPTLASLSSLSTASFSSLFGGASGARGTAIPTPAQACAEMQRAASAIGGVPPATGGPPATGSPSACGPSAFLPVLDPRKVVELATQPGDLVPRAVFKPIDLEVLKPTPPKIDMSKIKIPPPPRIHVPQVVTTRTFMPGARHPHISVTVR